MKSRDLAILFLLAALWGASFLFMRIAAPVLGPFVLIDLRVLIALLALIIYAMILKHRPNYLLKWKPYLLLGILNAAVPFCLIAIAELHLTASFAAILNATTPLFTTLVAWTWTKEPLSKKKLGGIVLGIAGVIILVGWGPISSEWDVLLAVCLSLLAALFYALGGIYSARVFQGEKPLDLAIGQQLAAGLLLIPFAVVHLPSQIPSVTVVLCVLGLAVLSTSLSYLLFFHLIDQVGPVKTLSVTFLVPVFGIIWGFIFLHARVYASTFIGLTVILLSVSLVTKTSLRFGRKRRPETISGDKR